jgi:hypothetical protein
VTPRHCSLAVSDPAELRFGVASRRLTTRHGLTIGGGVVYPERNFTLPLMFVNEQTMPDGDVKNPEREVSWLDTIQDTVETLPTDPDEFSGQMMGVVDTTKFVAGDYELS